MPTNIDIVSSTRPIIAVDVDEVLAMYLHSCTEWHNKTFDTDFEVSDYNSYTFCYTWGCTDEEARRRVYDFYSAPEFANLPVVPGAKEGIAQLARDFDLVVVTSRQDIIRDVTVDWLEKNFGVNTFKEVHFGNIWVADAKAIKRSKRELCLECGAIALIDDLPGYAADVATAGIKPILFDRDGAQGWSKLSPERAMGIPNLSICHSWEDVVKTCRAAFPQVAAGYRSSTESI